MSDFYGDDSDSDSRSQSSSTDESADGTIDDTFQPLTPKILQKYETIISGEYLFEFDWHNHYSTLLSNLEILHNENKLLDITIQPAIGGEFCDEKKFHKILLAAYNPKLLKSFLKSGVSDIQVTRLSAENLKALHQYVYQYEEDDSNDDNETDDSDQRKILQATGIDIREWDPIKLSENFKKLLTKKEILTINLATTEDSKSVPIHGALLAASSPYFKERIASDEMEILEGSLKVNFCSTTMDALVNFIYTANLNLNQQHVQDVFIASCKLQFPAVNDACTEFLSELLQPDNAQGILYLASFGLECNQHYGWELYSAAVEYIAKNFIEVSKEDEFLDMSFSELQDVLQNEKFLVQNADEALLAVMRWYNVKELRSSCLADLLKHLPLADMTASTLSLVEEEVKHLKDCSSILKNALYDKCPLLSHTDDYKLKSSCEIPEGSITSDDDNTDSYTEVPSTYPSTQYSESSYPSTEDSTTYPSTEFSAYPCIESVVSRYPSTEYSTSYPAGEDPATAYPWDHSRTTNDPYNEADSLTYPYDDDLLSKYSWDNYDPSYDWKPGEEVASVDGHQCYSNEIKPDETCYNPRRKDEQPYSHFKVNKDKLLKKNGEPDLRFKANKEAWVKDQVSKTEVPLTKSGKPDMRFKVNKQAVAKLMTETLAGEPDMRYKVNKEGAAAKSSNKKIRAQNSQPASVPVKADGTPDMRFRVNKERLVKQLTPVKSNPEQFKDIARKLHYYQGHLKKDGAPDKRYKENKAAHDSSSYRVEPVQANTRSDNSRWSTLGPTKRDGTPDMRYASNKALMELKPGGGRQSGRSTGYSDSSSSHRSTSSRPIKKDGTPDMRYAINKVASDISSGRLRGNSTSTSYYSSTSGPTKRDGTPDMRYAVNKYGSSGNKDYISKSRSSGGGSVSSYSSMPAPIKRDGTPDMRYAINKAGGYSNTRQSSGGFSVGGSSSYSSVSGPTKRDGTPDMRYAVNKGSYGGGGSSSSYSGSSRPSGGFSRGGSSGYSTGPLKKDGTPDMRYKANRR